MKILNNLFKNLDKNKIPSIEFCTRRVICPVVQHSDLGAFGGMGDFVSQTAALFPTIDWALPLTDRIRNTLGASLGKPVRSVPVKLFDPINRTPYGFDIDIYCHIAGNGSTAWLFHNKELLDLPAICRRITREEPRPAPDALNKWERFLNLAINLNGYSQNVPPGWRRTPFNSPGLKAIHPLLRRYVDRPDMLNAVIYGAVSKAIVEFMAGASSPYDVVWVQDWHFASIAGELLLRERTALAARTTYVQQLHNALYQGIYSGSEVGDLMGWPAGHFSDSLYRVNGQFNILGGALNALRWGRLRGKAVTVSEHHATELPSLERGAGLDHIFAPLKRNGLLIGINNPIRLPPHLLITRENEIETRKPAYKKMTQSYFDLEDNPQSFLLLWSHRFTHQKQVAAVLQAVDSLLETGHRDLQVAFFSDILEGSHTADVTRLRSLLDRFPRNVATRPFDPKQEMLIAAGADGAIMASYFEPFGYAPIWVAAQGGFILTGANGGQVDIFSPDSTFFLDIRPDIDKPRRLKTWGRRQLYEHFFLSRTAYRQMIFEHNTETIMEGILRAKEQYQSPRRRMEIMKSNMARIYELARSAKFKKEIQSQVFSAKANSAFDWQVRLSSTPGTIARIHDGCA